MKLYAIGDDWYVTASNAPLLALQVGSHNARHYVVGMRVDVGWQSRKLRHRVWRWLTKRNTRIARIDGGTIYLERCR